MKKNRGFYTRKLSPGRRAVIASASVTKEKNTIHSFTEIDITEPRHLIEEYYERTNEKLSFTGYITACFAKTVKEFPEANSFIKRYKQVFLDEITISVLVEKEIADEKVPEPVAIKNADVKRIRQISDELKIAKKTVTDSIGTLSGTGWIRFIPKSLLKAFVSIAEQNISMAKRYGKICVTAIGMYGKEGIWFIPHGSGTVLLTVGSINKKIIEINGKLAAREHLCLTTSFDHNIIDGAPGIRFLNRLIELIKSGELLKTELND